MRIAVIGAGGVGGYYAAQLARHGHDVALLARGEHLDAIRRDGLRITTPEESFAIAIDARDDIASFKGEIAIIAVKYYSLDTVGGITAALARRGALVLPLLNGVDAADRLESLGVPRARILGGLTYISAFRTAAGRIVRRSSFQRILVGELQGGASQRVEDVVGALASAGIEAEPSGDIRAELWRKLMFLAAMAAACGLARRPIGPLREDAMGRRLIQRAVGEVAAVARVAGVGIADDEEALALRALDSVPYDMKPSFLIDVERGGLNELEALSGAVARLGEKLGVPTLVHDTVVAALGSTGGTAEEHE